MQAIFLPRGARDSAITQDFTITKNHGKKILDDALKQPERTVNMTNIFGLNKNLPNRGGWVKNTSHEATAHEHAE